MRHIFIINPHAGKQDQKGRIYTMADRLREQGLPVLNSKSRGDLLVTVETMVPKRLTEQQKDILRQFAVASGDEPAPKPGRSIRDIFRNK